MTNPFQSQCCTIAIGFLGLVIIGVGVALLNRMPEWGVCLIVAPAALLVGVSSGFLLFPNSGCQRDNQEE